MNLNIKKGESVVVRHDVDCQHGVPKIKKSAHPYTTHVKQVYPDANKVQVTSGDVWDVVRAKNDQLITIHPNNIR